MDMFKRLLIAITLIAICLISISCSKSGSSMNGSGIIEEQNINIDDFDSLVIEGPFEVEIKQSPDYSLKIATDNNLLNRITVYREDNILKLNINAPATFYPTSLKASISMPDIESLKIYGNAVVGISGFETDSNFFLTARDKSVFGGYLKAHNINFKLFDSKVVLKGSANRLFLECSEKSTVDMSDYALHNADIILRSESEAILKVSNDINAVLTGTSILYYIGTPSFRNTSISDDSFIEQRFITQGN
jgi:hypothetical protein